jgi:hypothetical protein
MTRRRKLIVGVAAAGLLLAGCGGSGEIELYELEPTQECLVEADLRVTPKAPASDVIASTASGGALRIRFTDIRLTLTFGGSEAEAERTAQAYRQFAPKRFPIEDVLRRNRNVVELWEFAPSIDHQETLNRCLQS